MWIRIPYIPRYNNDKDVLRTKKRLEDMGFSHLEEFYLISIQKRIVQIRDSFKADNYKAVKYLQKIFVGVPLITHLSS